MEERLKEFVTLAAKTGRIYVSEDVYREIQSISEKVVSDNPLVQLEICLDPFLEPGTVVAAEMHSLRLNDI